MLTVGSRLLYDGWNWIDWSVVGIGIYIFVGGGLPSSSQSTHLPCTAEDLQYTPLSSSHSSSPTDFLSSQLSSHLFVGHGPACWTPACLLETARWSVLSGLTARCFPLACIVRDCFGFFVFAPRLRSSPPLVYSSLPQGELAMVCYVCLWLKAWWQIYEC